MYGEYLYILKKGTTSFLRKFSFYLLNEEKHGIISNYAKNKRYLL